MSWFDKPEVHHGARVVHLVPRDGLGGVEAAVRSLRTEEHPDLAVLYIAGSLIRPPGRLFRPLSPARSLSSPVAYWVALMKILRMRPEVLVCSLWRATFLGLLVKLLLPKTKLVVMIHATTIAHLADRLVTSIGCKVAAEVWCDSEASREVAQRRFKRTTRSLSFVVGAAVQGDQEGPRRSLDFVYWGRHVHSKGVPRAVRLFNRILAGRPEARFFIYGQEGPATARIREAMGEAMNPDAIQLLGAKPPGEYPQPISSCTFFLMTSMQEGMAIAVVEAMQLGLIPVVSPVGEIANYCESGTNAIIVNDDSRAANEAVQVASDEEIRARMSAAAAGTWAGVPDYSTDFEKNYSRLLAAGSEQRRDAVNG